MATVTVGCKLSNGLIIEVGEARAVLRGTNSANIIGGHGITENVDKELFDAWIEQHKDKDFIKKGFIFAHEKVANTSAEAKERADEKTGLEPLDPEEKPAGLSDVE